MLGAVLYPGGVHPLWAQAGAASIVADAPVRVSTGEMPHVEPHLAVNPIDPRNLVAATMVFPAPAAGSHIRVYVSFDGGRRWSQRRLDATPTRGDDPQVAFGPDGTAYLVHLPDAVRLSRDGGRTWSAPVPLPRDGGALDFPRLRVGAGGQLYIWASEVRRLSSGLRVYPLTLFRSRAASLAFEEPTRVLPNNINNQNGDLVLLGDGTLVGSFQELDVDGEFLTSPRLWVVRSQDGGRTFHPPLLVAEDFVALTPVLAVDRRRSGSPERLYLTWLGVKPTRNLYLAISEDAGASWSAPRPLLPEPWPEELRLPHSPMLAVAADGVLGLLWAEPVARPDGPCFVMSFTASLDAGETFLPPRRLTERPSCPETPANQIPIGENAARTVSRRWPDGGDYHGLVALPHGGFQALWSDGHRGVFTLWTTQIRVVRPAAR